MIDELDLIRQELADARRARVRVDQGVYVGRIDGVYAADVGGNRIPVTLTCPEPQINDRVHVWFMPGQVYVTGLVIPPPSEGTVGFVTATGAQVITDQGEYVIPFYAGQAPSSGQTVQLEYNAQGLRIAGALSTDVVAPIAPPAPVVSVVRQPDLFTATGSGSARRGTSNWWTNQVWASASNVGVYVYGAKVRQTLATAPPVRSVEIYLPVVRNRYGNMRLGWHALETRAGSTPTMQDPRVVGGGWVDITDLAGRLASGGGIGFDGAGETVFQGIPMNGKPGDPQAGALRITYQN